MKLFPLPAARLFLLSGLLWLAFAESAHAAEAVATSAHLNRLAGEKSPYLRQHADNPVDWYPWGEDAFEAARRENKPIFLSVGYSTCHWCHVMEHESFENAETAALLNKNFICIKVDREERPDVDRVYMAFLLAATGSGGWPMSVWLTPDRKPFFGGTYFPPENRDGYPGFPTVIKRVAEQWRTERDHLVQQSDQIIKALERDARAGAEKDGLSVADLRRRGLVEAEHAFDRQQGGFWTAPKFPQPVMLEFLLDVAATADGSARESGLRMMVKTLQAMAAGGLHDQLGGGFHRYSVDARWRLPHFEKMLYDQAQLANVYLSAAQLTGDSSLRATAEDTLRYVRERLTDPEGGFYTAEDADSVDPGNPEKRREGAYYVWTAREIEKILEPKEAQIFGFAHGVTAKGNVTEMGNAELAGMNVLYRAHSLEETSAKFDLSREAVESSLSRAALRLRQARDQRPRPPRDDKIVAAWNGLMISAFARAGQIWGEASYTRDAERAAEFLQAHLFDGTNGRLARSYRAGVRDDGGFAEDYSCVIQGLLDLYESTFEVRWLEWAIQLQEKQIALFNDEHDGGFFSSVAGDHNVVLRLKEDNEGAEPAASSVAVRNLVRLAEMLHRDEWRDLALRTARAYGTQLKKAPLEMPQMLASIGWLEGSPKLVLIHGETRFANTSTLMNEVQKRFLPRRVLVRIDSKSREFFESKVPLVRDFPRGEEEMATAYVCENFVCQLPTRDPVVLARLLAGKRNGKETR
jgi:uncharacterized protein YyaL (SSP411 family)